MIHINLLYPKASHRMGFIAYWNAMMELFLEVSWTHKTKSFLDQILEAVEKKKNERKTTT